MKSDLKDEFPKLWEKRFNGPELPITFFYTDDDRVPTPARKEDRCLIANLARVREGTPMRFGDKDIGCPGGRRYTGFAEGLRPDFEFFLSFGLPGPVERG